MAEGAAVVYRFGPFVLDVADRSLKDQGGPVALTPKQFDLLVALVKNAGRLVEKDALLRAVWPGVAIEEGNLTKGIFSLRQVLDRKDGSRYIETIPKRGYRFVAKKIGEDAPPVGPGEARDNSVAPLENSIAVMPFSDM